MQGDEVVGDWVDQHAIRHTEQERKQWSEEVAAACPDGKVALRRKDLYPELALKIDVTAINVLDLIDMDEGRMGS